MKSMTLRQPGHQHRYLKHIILNSELARQKAVYSNKPLSYPNGPAACTATCQILASNAAQIFGGSSHSYSGYVELHRYFGNGLNFYTGYGHRIFDADDRRGNKFEANTGLPGHMTYLKQSYMGLQYQINERWSAAADISFFEGTSNLSTKKNSDFISRNKYWNSIFARISYTF